jgi:hypothetical protein
MGAYQKISGLQPWMVNLMIPGLRVVVMRFAAGLKDNLRPGGSLP